MIDLAADNKAFVTSLTLLAVKNLGLESLDWEPEVLGIECADILGVDHLNKRTFDKINCGYTLIGTNAFTQSIECFLSATNIMNNLTFDSDEAPYVTFEMCAWSIWEYMNLTGEIHGIQPSEQFSPDIIKYIQEVGKVNGITVYPDWMKFAEPPPVQVPDMSDDKDLFTAYLARQDDYIATIKTKVMAKQELLKDQLLALKDAKLL